ncbi:MAG: hypothetical protein COA75_13180 [Cellvibrionales bacterium]|nr:MAG: hypothetical protein COA75_13180 [Cellvibrionales bacterium]
MREEEKTQQTLATLFNDLNTIIVIIHANGRVTHANTTPVTNPDAYQATSLNKKRWEYQAFSHDPTMQARIKTDIESALQSEHTQSDILIDTPGGLLWMQINIHPILDSQGLITQLLVEGNDIDQRKKMAALLLYAEQRRKLFREQTPMPVIEWRTDTFQLSGWNAASEALFGYSFAEAKGKGPDFLIPSGITVE